MVKAALANSLWWLASRRSHAAFFTALQDPDAAQEQVLRSFLRKNSCTVFCREHGLSERSNAADFAYRVPIRDYDELRPWIDRIQRGETRVLTAEPVRRLVPTSGSTAPRKLIPYTASMHSQLNQAISPWIFDIYRTYPQALLGVAYWSISPVCTDQLQFAEDSSIPIGFADDAEYLGSWRKFLIDAGMAVPSELKHIASVEDWRYITSLLLLRQRDLSLVSVWHPSFFSLLMQTIRDHWVQLLSDIYSGNCAVAKRLPSAASRAIRFRPDPRRSKELGSGGPPKIDQLWPKLKVLSCWTDGHAAAAAAELAQSLGAVVIQPKGLIATEGFISIPFGGQHPLAIRSHYLEFEDAAGLVRRPSELQQDYEYNVVLTTGGGLWRYRLDDHVVVDGMLGRTPSIRFVGKSAHLSDHVGEKLSDGFVASVFLNLFERGQTWPSFAMLAPDRDTTELRYTLYINADATEEMRTKLDGLLSANPHYAYCRRLGQLCPPRLFRVSDDAYSAYCQRLQAMGKRLGEIKPVGLSSLDGWSGKLNGHYIV
ncbi:MAG: GH3 auxin-responsive promoter family protein [Candidatus Sulfotelmatobacter sp.]